MAAERAPDQRRNADLASRSRHDAAPRAGGRSAHYPYQPALDGIRALAVAAVLAFHGGVAAMRGGFLGVDAFFVLSGFLITSLLLAEYDGTGRVSLPAFWARRARRLLPALLAVLVTVVVVARRLMPPEELGALRRDAIAALAYLANWRMAERSGDYFAATGAPSPLQHTWSLAIEEQFYLLWPLLLMAVLGRAGRGVAGTWRRRALPAVCVAGGVSSAVAAAVVFDPNRIDRAYYGTDTRIVALLVGCALAALLADRVRGAWAAVPGRPVLDRLRPVTRPSGGRGGGPVTRPSGGRGGVLGTRASGGRGGWSGHGASGGRGGVLGTRASGGRGGASGGGVSGAPGGAAGHQPEPVASGLYVSRHARRSRPTRHPVLGCCALAGAAVTGWLWGHADGGDGWLYRGGLTGAALAVAAVIAHATVSPGSPTARLLSVAPLTWLGRISYGVYLWHWPLFGWLDAERTGLSGAALFGARCAATLGLATISYLLVERPVRRSRRLDRQAWLVPASAGAAIAFVAAVAVLVTVPPAAPPAPTIALDQNLLAPKRVAGNGRSGPVASPMDRPGRRPGSKPRITFFGDSVSWSLGTYLPVQDRLEITVRAVQGCGIARLPDIRYIGSPHTNYPGCDTWDRRWRRKVTEDDPDLAVILLDRWELMDRRLDGGYGHVGQPAFDAYLNRELDLAIGVVTARHAHVVLLTAPYTRRAERPDGGLWPEDTPERVDAWNALLRAAARRHRASVIDLNARVCPDGKFTWRAGGVQIRSDGLHFTPEGVRRWIAPWLLPQLARLAVVGPPAQGPGA